MNLLSIFIGFLSFGAVVWVVNWCWSKMTLQLPEQTEAFLMSFGRFEKSFKTPGLYWVPSLLLPWTHLIKISKHIDYRTYKSIQVNDRFGTTVIIDLWLEFKISDPYRALFSVEHWEEALQSVVLHSTSSILSSQTIDEILKHRSELAERLQIAISIETERWGVQLRGAMIQNIGLLPEISKRFFQSVAAKIERTKALVEEEGRLKVASLEATTSRRIAELNGQARSQLPLEIGHFYKELLTDPNWLAQFQKFWELTNLDPRKTVTFSGFSDSPLGATEMAKAVESVMTH